jgi:hypothetical protein
MMSSGGRRTTVPQHQPPPDRRGPAWFRCTARIPRGVQLGPGGEGTAVHQPAWRLAGGVVVVPFAARGGGAAEGGEQDPDPIC